MADSNPVDLVLEFLRRNKFSRAEAALRSEFGNRPDLNGILQKFSLSDQESGIPSNKINGRTVVEEGRRTSIGHSGENLKDSPTSSGTEASKELIVKEVDCGTENGSENRWRSYRTLVGEQKKVNVSVGTSDKNFTFSRTSEDAECDLYPWVYGINEDPAALNQDDGGCTSLSNIPGLPVLGKAKSNSQNIYTGKTHKDLGENSTVLQEKRSSWPGSASNTSSELRHIECRLADQLEKPSVCPKGEIFYTSANTRGFLKECSVKTVFPFSKEDASTSYSGASSFIDLKEGKSKPELNGIRSAIKEQVDEVGRALFLRKTQEGSAERDFHVQYPKEDLPRLPPVRLRSEEKSFSIRWDEKYDQGGHDPNILNGENTHLIGSFLDVPMGQEINPSEKRLGGDSWLSVSLGIAEDTSDLVSGFATIGDGLSESFDYPNEYWDSDEYEDDDDVGYIRQPIEDETWFLANEIDYPSDNEKGAGHGVIPGPEEGAQKKNDEDDLSFAEEDSYFSGEQYSPSKDIDFVVQSDDLVGASTTQIYDKSNENDLMVGLDDDHHCSVRSIGVGISSDAADNHDARDVVSRRNASADDKFLHPLAKKHMDGGFSFLPPTDEQLPLGSSEWKRGNAAETDEIHQFCVANEDSLVSWRCKSSESSPTKSSRDDNLASDIKQIKKGDDLKGIDVGDEDAGTSLEDEEVAAVQEQVKQIKAQEEDFETFYLKIVHRKNRTGFEEDKSFHVDLNSVIAGRYHVTEYLGSAAFSKAVQAHDLHTGMDVCVKIIKNNKDFFDQSLDEIKLLKYVNKHDPADKYHILRLFDYFYYREHLLIVCELLKANLYEFHKFNRESGGEVYFTMPRLQSITIQCLEALQFLHSHGLIHCDLKPENILVKSYSRCEVKVIDLGSSCFETDHLCSYVQSRSYRAPEVILGHPYDKKIDIWSLGCVLAELCSGTVLFQNDSPATLLARVIGIIGPFEQEMLAKGRETFKYFTKNHMLYERNQDTSRLEYLIPKKSTLRHRLPMGDQGFVEFVAHLLRVNPKERPSAAEALKHPWLRYPYEPISS